MVGKRHQKAASDSAGKGSRMTKSLKFTRYEVKQDKTCYGYKDTNHNRGEHDTNSFH
jgi:hypothetical protein